LNILNVLSAKTSKSQEKLPKLAALPRLQLKDVENVLVESAESLDSFVCQFSRFNRDLETVADMMYEMYQQGTPPNFVTIPLQVGDVIAAMFTEDETWYRATVSGKNPDGSVSVTFIDYGNSETISKSDVGQRVRYLGKDLLRYPPMRGVACSLSRVSTDGQRFSWTPRAHEAFVRYVVEKEFRARLSSDSEPYKTILEDKSGSLHTWLVREKLVASKESEPEVVQDDFYELEVEVGTSCDVYVTSVINPENFFIQQVANTEAIDKGWFSM
jgi:tudor domain-containing protein 1/4/6/7